MGEYQSYGKAQERVHGGLPGVQERVQGGSQGYRKGKEQVKTVQ